MFYLDPQTNKRYRISTPFTYNERNYTKAGATHEKFIELGFTQVVIQPRPDDRFYIVSGPDNTGAYSSTPRDLDQLKTNFIDQDRQTARQLLSDTDWYIIRLLEVQSALPAGISTKRADIRAAQNTREQEINAATTVDELKQLVDSGLTAFPSDEDALGESSETQNTTPGSGSSY